MPYLTILSATLIAVLAVSCRSAPADPPEPEVLGILPPASSQGTDIQGIVDREVARRRARAQDAEALIRRGDALMEGGDAEQAREEYLKALELSR